MSRSVLDRVMVLLVALCMTAVPVSAEDGDDDRDRGGALFVMANSTDRVRGNEVAMYTRSSNGDLSLVGYFPTGHLGTGEPQLGSGPAPTAQVLSIAFGLPLVVASADALGSANSLLLDRGHRCLFAVNAGSNTVSSFRVRRSGLDRVSVVASRGVFPVSLTENDNVLYVLNSGGPGSLAGFRVRGNCRLSPLANSDVSLGGLADSFPLPNPGEVLTTPAQASFSPDGRLLVLSIKGGDAQPGPTLPSGRIAVFPVSGSGLLGGPVVTASSATGGTGGPFSFVFAGSRTLVVVHANSGTVGSYLVNANNTLSQIADAAIATFAPRWIVGNDQFVYTASFGAPSGVLEILGSPGLPDVNGVINGFRIDRHGNLTDLGPDAQVEYPAPGPGRSGNHAIDISLIGRFLYFLQPRTGSVGRLTVAEDGSLSDLVNFGGLSPGLEPFVGFNPGIHNFLTRCFLQDPEAPTFSPECRLGSAQGITGY